MRSTSVAAMIGASVLGAAMCTSLVGCVNPPIEGRADPYDAKQIHFDSDELRRDTAVGKPIATRDSNGLLHLTVPIRSAINKQLYIDYRVTFFDTNRTQIDRIDWTHKTLAANIPDQVDVTSADSRPADFQIDFRYPPGY